MRIKRLTQMYSQVRLVLRKLALHKDLHTMRTRRCFTDIKDIQFSFHSKTGRTKKGFRKGSPQGIRRLRLAQR